MNNIKLLKLFLALRCFSTETVKSSKDLEAIVLLMLFNVVSDVSDKH